MTKTNPIHRLSHAILAAVVGLGVYASSTTTVRAQDAKPDKSGYTLFNPTPESALRDFSADRPAKNYGATTIDAGKVQAEVELFNYSKLDFEGVRTTTYTGPNPNVRIGLTNDLELQLSGTPFVRQNVRDSFAGTSTSASGSSDFFVRAKRNIWGNEGGRTALAIMPYIKFGTAPASLGGNQTTEGGVIVPYSISLADNRTLLFNTEVDFLKNTNGDGFHQQYINAVSLSGPIAKDVTLTGELWSQINVDPARTGHQYSFDTALAWVPKPNLQLDIGANFGLNRETPAIQLYTGITRRF